MFFVWMIYVFTRVRCWGHVSSGNYLINYDSAKIWTMANMGWFNNKKRLRDMAEYLDEFKI
jgi:hypothetical protein